MAIVFADSFDTYQTVADASKRYISVDGGVTLSGIGRTKNAMIFDNGGGAVRAVPAQSTYLVGFAWRIAGFYSGNAYFLAFQGATTGTNQINIGITITGALFVARSTGQTVVNSPGGGTILAYSPAGTINTDTWYYIEARVLISDTVGEVEVRVNGVPVIETADLSSRDTRYDDSTIGSIAFGGNAYGGGRVDDLYICDVTGGVNDTFLGDIAVEALLPSASGTNSDFTGSDGDSTNNYALVDETYGDVDFPDEDSTYVQSATIGHYDTYNYPALSTTASVLGVQVCVCAKKADPGTRTYKAVVKLSGGSETDGSVTQSPSDSSYTYGLEVWNEKPGGGSWSVSDVDNAEFGVTVAG